MNFRVKVGGKLSSLIKDELGVNQGGNASPTLFRKYLADLREYLSKHVGICVSDNTIAHLLWADDLVLLSDTAAGLQTQLDGLLQFCTKYLLIVNEMKTKVMVFGNDTKSEFSFNCIQVERVDKYKYLGVIINSTKGSKMDIFASNADYLCHQAWRAILSIHRKTKYISPLPLNIACHLYRSLVQPIMLYGSDVWGKSASVYASNDKLFNWFLWCTLGVKSSTSNLVTVGEWPDTSQRNCPYEYLVLRRKAEKVTRVMYCKASLQWIMSYELLWFHQLGYTCTRASADLRFTQLYRRGDWI